MFDGDKAGREATTSAIEVLKEINITPKVISLEENLDPDEYILKYGEEKFAYKIATRIVNARENAPIKTTVELANIIAAAYPAAAFSPSPSVWSIRYMRP